MFLSYQALNLGRVKLQSLSQFRWGERSNFSLVLFIQLQVLSVDCMILIQESAETWAKFTGEAWSSPFLALCFSGIPTLQPHFSAVMAVSGTVFQFLRTQRPEFSRETSAFSNHSVPKPKPKTEKLPFCLSHLPNFDPATKSTCFGSLPSIFRQLFFLQLFNCYL